MLPWIAVIAFVAAALLVDLRVAGRGTPSLRSAAAWSVGWIVIGVAFAGVLLVLDGGRAASEYLAGFAVEKSLSLDNLFVFAVLFGFFAVPADERRRVLVYGIAGAIALRALFIVVGVTALEAFHPTTYVLGALLGLTAWKIARERHRRPHRPREDPGHARPAPRVPPRADAGARRDGDGGRVRRDVRDRLHPRRASRSRATGSSSSRPTRSACWAW